MKAQAKTTDESRLPMTLRPGAIFGGSIALLLFAIWSYSSLQSHERPTPAQLEEARQRGDLEQRLNFMKSLGNDRMSEELVEQAQNKILRASMEASGMSPSMVGSFAPPIGRRGLPTTGSPKVLTLLCDFSDYRAPASPSPADFASNFYGNGTAAAQAFAPFESMNRYYYRASEGLLNLQGNVLGWYQFPNNKSSYQVNTYGDAAHNQAVFNIFKTAMNHYNATHDFSQYDNDGDGFIDSVTLLYNGPNTGWGSFWWAYQWSFFVNDAATTTWDGKKIKKFVFQFISKRGTGNTDVDPKVLCHEMGHLLGLADYYDYTPSQNPRGGIGGLDMMDANKGNHNAFSRWVLDWINPTVVGSGAPTLRTLNASGDTSLVGNKAVVIFPNASNPFSQFFVVENRFRLGNDAGQSSMPTDGLLIWHVDATLNTAGNDFKNNNSDTTPKLIKLVQADGLNQIEAGGSADAGDYFTSAKSFTANTNPSSNSHQGNVTNVSVTNISAANRVMTAMIGFGNASTQVVATPVITPPGGTMTSATNVTITCDTSGSIIRYTTDGSSPSASSPAYTAPFTVTTTTTIKAKAFKSGLTDSAIATATFNFNGAVTLTDGVAKTGLSGATNSATFYVINIPAGETKLEIKTYGGTGDVDMYVKRGSLPSLTSYDYRPYVSGNAETVTVSNPTAGSWYIMIFGYSAYSSVSLMADYSRLTAKVATPVFSPVAGTYNGAVNVVISCVTSGASIRYTLDKTNPTSSSPLYTAPVNITATSQIRARAFFPSYTDSDVKTGDYTINGNSSVVSLTDGVVLGSRAGTLGSAAYYKIEVPANQTSLDIKTYGGTGDVDLYVRRGSLPTVSAYDYRPYQSGNTEAVSITNPLSGTWYIMLHGYAAYSGVSLLADYNRILGVVATPAFSPVPGTYSGSVNVALSCATVGAVIRYTTDGSIPTTLSAAYSVPFTLTSTKTVKAKAFLTSYTDSAVATGVYTVNAVSDLVTLVDGVAKVASGAISSEKFYMITVPSGQNKLVIKTYGGTGDVDLYVRRGNRPTSTTYDYRPYLSGNTETVEIINPAADNWYIMLRGFAAYTSVSLLADYSTILLPVANPVFTPGAGTYTAAPLSVSINSATAGAYIYYTTDGSIPTTSSQLYTGPLSLISTTTVKALATKSGFSNSAVTSGVFTINATTVTDLTDGVAKAVPTSTVGSQRVYKINVPSGMAKLDIKIYGGTGDCDLYVKQGGIPTTSVYDYRPFLSGNAESITVNNPVSGDWYIMLYGYSSYSGLAVLADYVASLVTTATPTFSPVGGTFTTGVNVSLTSATIGATIRYTLDGQDPSASSNVYSGPIHISSTTTVKARAYKAGNNESAVASATYTISGPTVTTLSSGVAKTALAGAYNSQSYFRITVPSGQAKLDLAISGGTGDCDLYVKQGSLPSLNTWDYRPYIGGNAELVSINNPAAGDWYVMLHGYSAYSGVQLIGTYISSLLTVATPVISPAAGAYNPPQNITITCATPGATIYYTTDGSSPTTSSQIYSSPFALNQSATISAIAAKSGSNTSAVATGIYTMNSTVMVTLTDGVAKTGLSGGLNSQSFFKIIVPTSQAKLVIKTSGGIGDCDLYVKYGQLPSLNVWDYRPYIGGNTETVTIDAPAAGVWFVMLNGYSSYSAVSLLADYLAGTVANPTFSPVPGTYNTANLPQVTLTTTTSGASIRYTLDGATPDSLSPVYSGPITISTTTTVKAQAFRSNFADSAVVTGVYTITGPPVTTLSDGVTKASLSGAANSFQYFVINVPAGQAKLDVKISGGSGDADLYVRQGQLPSLAEWDYRPYVGGNNELVTVPTPAAGNWYIMLAGYSSYSAVSLLADYSSNLGIVATPVLTPGTSTSGSPIVVNMSCATAGATIRYTTDGSTPTASSTAYVGPVTIATTSTVKAIATLSQFTDSAIATATYTVSGSTLTTIFDGAVVSGLSGTTGSAKYFVINVPSGQQSLTFTTSGGTGDCDIYVRYGQAPTKSLYDYRPYIGGNYEDVYVNAPAAGSWYVMVDGYSAYSGVSLVADYQSSLGTVATPLISPGSSTSTSALSVSISCATAGATIRYTTDGSTPNSSSPVYTAPITINATSTVKAFASLVQYSDSAVASATYTINLPAVTPVLMGVPLLGQAGASNNTTLYKLTVPSGSTETLRISTAGGSGDCDLYIKYGSAPDLGTWDYRPYLGGNSETVDIVTPIAGDYYIMLHAWSAYTDVTLSAFTYRSLTVPGSLSSQSGSLGSFQYIKIIVPAGATQLSVSISGGTGDCDLYLKSGSIPTLDVYDFRPYVPGNTESISVPSPQAGEWIIGLQGFASYSGLTVNVSTL